MLSQSWWGRWPEGTGHMRPTETEWKTWFLPSGQSPAPPPWSACLPTSLLASDRRPPQQARAQLHPAPSTPPVPVSASVLTALTSGRPNTEQEVSSPLPPWGSPQVLPLSLQKLGQSTPLVSGWMQACAHMHTLMRARPSLEGPASLLPSSREAPSPSRPASGSGPARPRVGSE